MNAAIRTQNLTRLFDSLRAVDGVDLEVDPGTVFGYLGPNGSGKTTTIRLLLGLLEPSEGSAQVLGFDTRSQASEIRQRVGALLEHSGLYERLNAEDNLRFYGRVWHVPEAELNARIQALLGELGLWERRRDTVSTWSRGMKQKLAMARVLLHKPQLVFLDEPTAGLDPIAAAALRDELAGLVRQQGMTVFLTTHNLAEAEKLCDRVAVIRSGKLLMTGSPDELRRQTGQARLEVLGRGFTEAAVASLRGRAEVRGVEVNGQRLLIDLNGEVDTAPLVQQLVAAGVQIDEVRRGKASLEEAFLAMMEEEETAA